MMSSSTKGKVVTAVMNAATKDNGPATLDSATARAGPEAAPTNVPPSRVTAGPKLRGCCQSCAQSKVRCTKEKPSCARCEAKGIACRYLQSKRPGRIPGSGARRANPAANNSDHRSNPGAPLQRSSNGVPSSHTNDAADDQVATFLASPASTESNSALFNSYYGAPNTTGLDPSCTLDGDGDHNVPFIWNDCLDVLSTKDDTMYTSLMDWDSTSSAFTASLPLDVESVPGWGSSIISPTRQLLPRTSQNSSTATGLAEMSPRISSSASSSSSLTSSLSPTLNLLDLSKRTTSPAGSTIDQRQPRFAQLDAISSGNQEANSPLTCGCIGQALDLLKVVANDQCAEASPPSSNSLTEAILAKNKEIIQATLALLVCASCRDDRLLLMISLLITMKILPRYASAAALTGSAASRSESFMETSRPDNTRLATVVSQAREHTYPRQAKQQVLRELHLVQRLITQLSTRLKGLASPGIDAGSTAGLLEPQSLLHQSENSDSTHKARMRPSPLLAASGSTGIIPISTRTLDLAEDDARNSLSTLSAVVRNALKDS